MITSYGSHYSDAFKGIITQNRAYSIRRLGHRRWLVYKVGSPLPTEISQMVSILPSKLRAYYVATVLSGIDASNYFYFGNNL